MKCTIKLSEAERHTLQQMSVNHQHRDIRTRAAGLLLLGDGLSAPKAAARLNVSAQSIYNWSRLWAEQGLCGLLSGHGGGRPRALSEAMLATAMEVARTESMTLGQIAKRIEAVHGEPMPCALETLSIALRREGFSFKRNRFSLKKSGIRKTSR
ncbi:helix-turn-helix domain-containing protein [Paraburkholderia sp. 1N]|uniref:Helix-turn-helix domain-containing protein n=2 Tax=Paraburkholderia solitsugae TaxID=2675748 RepID=A0ABX2BQC2_9BURK|nr:helix-turn-helix domain-containing protein [Paraburkholderia solitsugae]NPT42934.1 helix-turn-helix domain-containing protein [Paraburkholderia solitsugae]